MPSRFVWIACFSVLMTSASRGDDWPCWKGPAHNGISAEAGWAPWGAGGPHIAWRAQAGVGFSSFVVAQGRVVTAGFADEADTIICLDVDSGRELWKYTYPSELGDKFFEGGTTGTPTIDGDRVFFLSRWGDVCCLDSATGKVIWTKNVLKDHGLRVPGWGFGGAPLVYENLVILNVGEAGLALEKATGKMVWKSANKDSGYSTPYLARMGGEPLVIFGSGQSYVAANPLTGKEAWRVRWLTQYGVNASDPIIDGTRMFISTGYGKGCTLMELSAGQPPRELWKSKVLHTQLNGAVLFDGYLYGPDGDTTETASLKCVELATGTEKWSHPGFGTGSVIVADAKLIALSASGELAVAPATSEGYKPVAKTQLFEGKCWTTPVLSGGRIFGRNWKGHIVCVDVRK